jgi:hypothetical protein
MAKLESKIMNVVDVHVWDGLVEDTYGRPYAFQQQDGCKQRGTYHFTVPCEYPEDYERDSIPEKVNGNEMGVSFKAWLERDPQQPLDSPDKWERESGLSLFYARNFYPDIEVLANDLYDKGLIDAGEYLIDIDW